MSIAGSLLGGLVSSAASSAMGHLNNYISGLMNVGFQKQLQDHAAAVNYEYSEKSARNVPTWNRAGLEGAGYNPMLAVQNATSGANSSWTSAGQYTQGNLPDSVTSGITNAQSFQRLQNETHTAETTATMNEATARNQNAEAANKELQNPYVTKRQEAELGKIEAETANVNRNTEYFEALEHNMEVMQRLQEFGINMDFAGRKYGADKAYNASTYATNMNNETQRGIRTDKLPFGFSSTYYDLRGKDDNRFRNGNIDVNDQKYWHHY